MPAAHLLEEGKKEYTSKRYADAVKLISKAISIHKVSLATHVEALDLRCQAYSKLGKHDLALQDARRMVHLSKRKSSTGYLRCSQIERASGNYSAAIRWLEHGLKNVPRQRRLFADQLRRVNELVQTNVIHQRRQDPITSVPLEILQHLLSYLKYREVICLLRVSRSWRNVLSNIPPLTNHIDFRHCRKRISYQSCVAALKMLRKPVRSVILGPMSHSAVNAMQSWLNKFTNFEPLEVLHFGDAAIRFDLVRHDKLRQIKSLRVSKEQRLSLKKIFGIVAECQSLEEIVVHGIGNECLSHVQNSLQTRLQHLELFADEGSKFVLPISLLMKYPNLQTLSICGGHFQSAILNFNDLHNLRKIRLELLEQDILELHLPSSLEDLDCDGSFTPSQASVFNFTEPLSVPNLRKVTFREAWELRFIRLLESSVSPPHLHEVDFRHSSHEFFKRETAQNWSIFRSCQTLAFSSQALTDNDSGKFSTYFPNIEKLVLEAPMVTGVFISDIIKDSKQTLKQIVLRDCPRISSDIIAWLKARGVECRLSESTHLSAGGRRIRGV